ncbi:MAG: DUF4383 domain-containing protein [Anaerolineales bacterium]|nr:DUF4383 domain-containing protein [Anaerolineales bacterium]
MAIISSPKLSTLKIQGAFMKISLIQKLAWVYAIMFAILGSLSFIPFINDVQGYTLGIFKLEWYDNLLHYVSGAWAAWAAWRSLKDSTFYFKLFGIIYGLDGVTGFLFGQGYLDCGIFLFGYTALDWKLKFFANIPHIAIGGIAVLIGFVLSKRLASNEQA